MTRYYTRTYRPSIYLHESVADILHRTYVLVWDHKTKKHSFLSLEGMEWNAKYGYKPTSVPVVFECPEHEREFLDFHPDADIVRREYRSGYWYKTSVVAFSEEEFPLEKRRGRWCWKKA